MEDQQSEKYGVVFMWCKCVIIKIILIVFEFPSDKTVSYNECLQTDPGINFTCLKNKELLVSIESSTFLITHGWN